MQLIAITDCDYFMPDCREFTYCVCIFIPTAQPLAQSSAHKTVLQKSKTIELFDEDANTESPEMSQHSRNPGWFIYMAYVNTGNISLTLAF